MNLIGNAIKTKLNSINPSTCHYDDLNSFFICDLGEVDNLVKLWTDNIPRIKPYYAVKCNNNLQLIEKINKLGLGFDCASQNEIELILKQGIDASRIIYANPCKSIPYIKYANEKDINLTTVDNYDELLKMKEYHCNSGVLIRLQTDDTSSTCPLSVKFGASLNESMLLIDHCMELGLNLKGVAFHIGSGCNDFKTIELAISDSKKLFNYTFEKYGLVLNMLDIGGGFSKSTFMNSSTILSKSLNSHFPVLEYGHLQIISELGRFLAETCFTLAVNITSKRRDLIGELQLSDLKERIYLNDGVYGNLNCILFDHQKVDPKVLTSNGEFVFFENYSNDRSEKSVNNKEFSIWGPTCDGLDCISLNCKLSHDVNVGDWLYFKNIGAYTSVASTCFNGFKNNTECLYVDSSL
ncbi:hypothetical protein CANARDRAFT_203367 [[Candida] arabinofermentans NRRL YB-2248]|uniref:ornithine decarboxylase n=1 Tax=[Candida] arabinofermentans NRRL YB-2248 TaxID=983967 RepID=A0A1E4SUX4_9ASCO|nr:hypothetical protein CANARDRAFT_203367 [[Candida] arabinofermentans NRRL YB-2248]